MSIDLDEQILNWSREYNFTRDGTNLLKKDDIDNDPKYIKMTLIDKWNITNRQIFTLNRYTIDSIKIFIEDARNRDEYNKFEDKTLFLSTIGTNDFTIEKLFELINIIKNEKDSNERIRKFIKWGGDNNIPLWSNDKFNFNHTAYLNNELGFRIGHLTILPRLLYQLINKDFQKIIGIMNNKNQEVLSN